MNKLVKKILVGVMAATMALGSVTTAFAAGSPTEAQEPARNVETQAENGSTVNTSKKGNATVSAIAETTKKNVTLSSKVEVDGVKYTVTRITDKAFAKATNATKISLPSTITSFGPQAFSGVAASVKTIAITSKDTIKVNKTAFKGVDTKKMTITVKVSSKGMSTKEYNKFVKALKAAGFKGTIKKVK